MAQPLFLRRERNPEGKNPESIKLSSSDLEKRSRKVKIENKEKKKKKTEERKWRALIMIVSYYRCSKKKKKVVKRLRSKGGFVVLLWKGASLPGSRGDMGIKLKLKSIKH